MLVNVCLPWDGSYKEPGMMYFLNKSGAQESQNLQNHRVVVVLSKLRKMVFVVKASISLTCLFGIFEDDFPLCPRLIIC